jgi:hypothetical protein
MVQDPNKVNLVGIQSRIAQIKNIIEIEKNEQEAELYWQSRMIAMMLFYVFLVITICSVARHLGLTSTTLIPIFGLNLSTVMWAAVGSLAAILYRLYTFYTDDEKIPHRAEFRWLVARPLIGIIMGGLATLAVRIGIIVFTGVTPDDVREELGPLQATYWTLPFWRVLATSFTRESLTYSLNAHHLLALKHQPLSKHPERHG